MEYYWEVLGRDGIILAQAGSVREPQTFTVTANVPSTKNGNTLPGDKNATGNASIIYIAVGVSVVVVAGVITAIYFLQPQTANATVSVVCENNSCFP